MEPEAGSEEGWGGDEWEHFMWGKEKKEFLDFPVLGGETLRVNQNISGARGDLGSSDGLHTTGISTLLASYIHPTGSYILQLGSEVKYLFKYRGEIPPFATFPPVCPPL